LAQRGGASGSGELRQTCGSLPHLPLIPSAVKANNGRRYGRNVEKGLLVIFGR
jgi:hypothetical protein